MLELLDVSLRFGEKIILQNFSHTFLPGKVTCLLGPSGCGKTTLLRVASGLLLPDAGTVHTSQGRVSMVFQEDRLLPWFNALENLTTVGIGEKTAIQYAQAVGLGEELHTLPPDLSGGMRRRLAIARAMAYGGDVFLLDEPLRGLDAATAQPVLDLMRETLRGKTTLLITHNETEALALADVLLAVDGPPLHITKSAAAQHFQDTQALKGWLDAVENG